jgi:hypothetical protein
MQERDNAGIQFNKANHMSLSSTLPCFNHLVWHSGTEDLAIATGPQANSTNGRFGYLAFILQGAIGENQDWLLNDVSEKSFWSA